MTVVLWCLAFGVLAIVPMYAWWVRGRVYALFAFVILGLSLPGALATHGRLVAWWPSVLAPVVALAFAYPLAAAALHLGSLVRARLRPPSFRFLVSLPGMTFIAAGFLAGLWLLALLPIRAVLDAADLDRALALTRWLDLLPFGVAGLSVVTSMRLRDEVVRIPLAPVVAPPQDATTSRPDPTGTSALTRIEVDRHRRDPPPLPQRPLRIVQIADPHLGPWQPVRTLQRRIERLLRHDPDLVLLTGDFLTMEGTGSTGALAEALCPLESFGNRCFAILGNHDHDDGARGEVERALARNRVHLLVDAETSVTTATGYVQLVGADWVGRGRREHIRDLLARHPRRDEHLRLLLLHDPSVFRHVPPGDVDLALAGHTHGGQLGLLSVGLRWTVLSRSAWPDHGLFAHGASRLYVHRGTGFYGFPLRVGVPGEASLLEVVIRSNARNFS